MPSASNPVFLSRGFRPFFLSAGLWAFAAIAIWVAFLLQDIDLPTAFAPADWHGHEMTFGYAACVIAGFLLTAIPNWTGRLPVKGAALAALAALWWLGRLAFFMNDWLGPWLTAILDLAFLWILLLLVLREIATGKNWRNLPVAAMLGLLAIANTLFHLETLAIAETAAIGLRLGLATVLLLITLIGGRVVPSFTRNWLAKRGEQKLPVATNRFDLLALLASATALLLWAFIGEGSLVGALLIAAGILNLARLTRWRFQKTAGEALVWVMHLAYVWLPLGLTLLGLAEFVDPLLPTIGLHALTVGAVGTMTLAIMTRATLGHSGRPLTADGFTTVIYIAITLAAVARVFLPLSDAWIELGHGLGSLCWLLAFALYVWRFGPLQLGRR